MHVIRLRGPWQSRDLSGMVRCRRTFHKPTGLETGEQVWLVVEPRSRATVHLNGRLLGDVQPGTAAGRFDVTGLLDDGNALEIDVERGAPGEAGAGGLVGEVRLEIA
jgi:hypothetical protein